MCFGGGSSPPPPTPPAPPPSKLDEGAAARQAQVNIIRQKQSGGQPAMAGTSPTGLTTAAPTASKTLLGA